MSKVGLTRAAELTGKSPSTVHRAMRKGRLSFETDEHGTRFVDTAELERVFGLLPQGSASRTSAAQLHSDGAHATDMRVEIEVSRVKLALLEERVRDLLIERDELKRDRDGWRAQAERLLTDQREPPAIPEPKPRRRWRLWML